MQSFLEIFNLAISICFYIIFAQFILSWLVAFDVVNVRQRFVGQLWDGLNRITEPVYRPIRNFLPNMGGIDLSPMIVLFLLFAVQRVINNNLAPLAY
ncbi:MAG: YggT family protein [Pikeienuella sp.]